VAPRAPQVCNCFDVDAAAIAQAAAGCAPDLDDDARLAAVQAGLRCGTQCGSCLPAVKALVRRPDTQAMPA
jgi:assimilatory nitrate reductase catalytic subunit